jgi:hypothetical protein
LAASKRFDFTVPNDLRQSKARVYAIAIDGDDFAIDFFDRKDKLQRVKSFIMGDKDNDIKSVGDLIESRLSFFFDTETTLYCARRLTEVLDRLYQDGAAHVIDRIKKQQKAEAAKLDAQSGEGGRRKEKPVYTVKKYSRGFLGGGGLAEAVIINGKPFFAVTINGGTSVTFYDELETENMILRPPTLQEYPPNSAVEFASEDELMECIRYALEEDTLYQLYHDIKKYYTREYFVDTDPHNAVLLTIYTITSYFQDKFSTTPYIWLIGDNGSGKGSILIVYSYLGYRVFYMSGASGANILEYLGTVEEGGGTVAEDELDDLDKDPHKRQLYMTGYASGAFVPKILDGNTKGREQRYWHSYCQKMAASEKLPSMKYSKGVLDREFIIKCVKGFPRYNAKSIKKRTRTPEVLRLISEMETVRKRLFAYRLVHYGDVVEEIQGGGLSISGRALELTESALLLFHKHISTPQDQEIFENEILPTLSSFLKDRLGRRNDSLEGRLYPIIRMMVDANGTDEFDNDTIYNTVCAEMEGKEIPGKTDNIFYVDDLGMTVTRTKIMNVLREKFKATKARIIFPDGSTKRGHKISIEALERIRASYEDAWEIKILLEDTSDQPNQVNQVLDKYGEEKSNENDRAGGSEDTTTTENMYENPVNDAENTQTDMIGDRENTSYISTDPGLPGLPGQRYPIEESLSNQVSPIALEEKTSVKNDDNGNISQLPASTAACIPDSGVKNTLEEDFFWETFDRLERQKQDRRVVSESMLKQELISSGKFDAGPAAQIIKDMIAIGKLTRLEFDVLCKK